tara:strand:+ start:1238 stop:1522 length:285 start_codon:yes stop_codon:yes gene_type:complete
MFVKLVKINERVIKGKTDYYLSEVSINILQISYMSENTIFKQMLSEGSLNLDLNANASFTDLKLNTKQTITVVGTPSLIETKILLNSNKQLLRG